MKAFRVRTAATTLLACGAIVVGFVVARSNGPTEPAVPIEGLEHADEGVRATTLAPGAHGMVPVAEPAGPLRYRVGWNARALVGRVVARADGRAVAGAVVTSEVTGVLGDETATTTTDPQGGFQVAVPGEKANLRIAAPGYAPVERFGVVPEKELLIRLSPAPRLVGRVVDEQGAPVAGVTVRTRAGGGVVAHVVGETMSDADGRFALEGLPIGELDVVARGRGWIPHAPPSVSVPWSRDRRISLEPGRTTDVTLVVARGFEVRGRLLDVDGAPVADAPVWCESEYGDPELAWSGAWPAPLATTGPDGAFVVSSLFRGVRYFVSARAADGRHAHSAAPPASSAPIPIELRLSAPCFVDVKVSDVETKAPIPGALVDVGVSWDGRYRPDDRRWTTGSDGLVRVGPLPPLRGQVSASVAGYHQTFASDFVQATPEGVPARIGLARQTRVTGRVVWPDGAAASGSRVRVRGTVGFVGADRFVTTDEGGSFESGDVNPGPCRVAASELRDGQPFSVEAEAVAGGPPVVLTLAPGALPVPPSATPAAGYRSLRVRVVDPDGNPVPTATVRWGGSEATAREGVAVVEGREGRAATIEAYDARDDEGMALPLGPGVVRVLDLEVGEVTVRLTPGRALAGRVVGPDGEPVSSVAVSLQPVLPGGVATDWPPTHASTWTDSDGAFRAASLGEGEYAIVVRPEPGLFPPRTPVRARAGAANVVVALHRAAAATIIVTDARGAPVEGALVSVSGRGWRYAMTSGTRSRTRRLLGTSYAELRTDPRGEARLVGLDPETMEASLLVLPPWNRPDLGPVSAEPFAPRDRTVVLPEVATIRGTVVDDEGRPVRVGRVLYRRDGTWSQVAVNDDARFVVGGVSPGEYELAAAPHAQDAPSPGATIVRARTGDSAVVVRLATGAALNVTVDGAEADEFTIFRLRPETPDDRGGTRFESGLKTSARFVGVLASARYALTVRSGDRVGVATDLVPRTDPYVVRLEKGLSSTGRVTAPVAVYVQRVVATGPEAGMDVTATTDGERYTLVGLVPGSWTITVEARDEECRLWRGTVTARAGEPADVALSPEGR